MAQVGVQQPSNLMEMFSSPSPMLWDIASQQVNDQTLGNLINRQQAAQSMDIEKQKLPYELQQLDLQNQETGARIPGVQAQSGLAQNNLKVSNATLDQQTKAKISDLAKNISDNDLAVAENGIKQMMTSDDPVARAHGKAMFPFLSEIAKERDKLSIQGGNQIAAIREQNAGQLALENQQAAHGKYAKAFNVGLNTKLMLEGDPLKRDTLLRGAIQQATQQGDQERVQELTAYLDANKPAYDSAMRAKMAAVGGKPDAAVLTGMQPVEIPTAQPPVGQQTAPEAPDKLQFGPNDQAALKWAISNPNDPRAEKILKKLGVK